jgi:FixJ family two-component response regulator
MGVRVLVVSARARVNEKLSKMLAGRAERLVRASTEAEAVEAARGGVDLVLIDVKIGGGRGAALSEKMHACGELVTVLVSEECEGEVALEAMRSGAADLIDPALPPSVLRVRLMAAAMRAARVRAREEKAARLARLCGQLNTAREKVSEQVGSLCNDLVEAYRNLAEQVEDVGVVHELGAILRQELDVEALLRAVLEYVLGKMGQTNAAVYLPSTSGEWSLGAYINADRERATCEVMLDQLAQVLPERFETRAGVCEIDGALQFEDELWPSGGGDAGLTEWLGSSRMLVCSAIHEGECLAVVSLFRDRGREFTEEHRRVLGVCARLFGAQLARVIRVHHRHLPEEEWGRGFDPEDSPDDGRGDGRGSGDWRRERRGDQDDLDGFGLAA